MLKKSGRILFGLVLVAIFAGHAAAWYRLPLLSELEAILVLRLMSQTIAL